MWLRLPLSQRHQLELMFRVVSLESLKTRRKLVTPKSFVPTSARVTLGSRARRRGTRQWETRGAKLTHRRMLATQGPSLPPFCSLTKTHVVKFISFHRLECTEQRGTRERVCPHEILLKANYCGFLLITLTSSAFRLPSRLGLGHKHRVMGHPVGKGNFT